MSPSGAAPPPAASGVARGCYTRQGALYSLAGMMGIALALVLVLSAVQLLLVDPSERVEQGQLRYVKVNNHSGGHAVHDPQSSNHANGTTPSVPGATVAGAQHAGHSSTEPQSSSHVNATTPSVPGATVADAQHAANSPQPQSRVPSPKADVDVCTTPARVCHVACVGPCATLCEPCSPDDAHDAVCMHTTTPAQQTAALEAWGIQVRERHETTIDNMTHTFVQPHIECDTLSPTAPSEQQRQLCSRLQAAAAAGINATRDMFAWDWQSESEQRGSMPHKKHALIDNKHYVVSLGFAPAPTTFVWWAVPVFTSEDIAYTHEPGDDDPNDPFTGTKLPRPPRGSFTLTADPFLVRRNGSFTLFMETIVGNKVRRKAIGHAHAPYASYVAELCLRATSDSGWGAAVDGDSGQPASHAGAGRWAGVVPSDVGRPYKLPDQRSSGEESQVLQHFQWGGVVTGLDATQPIRYSFPYVFEHNNSWYMLPQRDNGPLELYENVEWPGKWAKVAKLRNKNRGMGDASIVCWQGRWYLFIPITRGKEQRDSFIELWHSDVLTGPYEQHPASPVGRDPKSSTARVDAIRGAGRVIEYRGALVRFAQPYRTVSVYGQRVVPVIITKLTATDYEEHAHDTAACTVAMDLWQPDSGMNNSAQVRGWNAWRQMGTHHVDWQRVYDATKHGTSPATSGTDLWMAALDGRTGGDPNHYMRHHKLPYKL